MIRRAVLIRAAFALVAFALFTSPAAAQLRAASLTGQVVDPTGAVIPQATIAIRRSATGFERRVEADSQGAFSIAELAPGDYEVTATSAGFAVAVQRVSLR